MLKNLSKNVTKR